MIWSSIHSSTVDAKYDSDDGNYDHHVDTDDDGDGERTGTESSVCALSLHKVYVNLPS